MYKIDEDFLESVGLAGIPDTQKEAFMNYAQDQLETRIGEKMSEGMSDEQLEEFEKIIDNDADTMDRWLAGDYQNDELYQKLSAALGEENENLKNDYVTAKWLNQNCPSYQEIIKETLEALREEISANKDALLASM